jgi:dolichol-phosphate mannosyltransferase
MRVFIIPATYNEKGNIERLISVMEEDVFPRIKNHDLHILVADDNSPDGTAESVRELMKKWKNIDINVGEKKGLGAAYLRAMTYAIEKKGADIVLSIDADFQHDPMRIPVFLDKIDQGYDVVTGTRYSEGGSMPSNWPLMRKIYSIVGNTTVRIITGRFSLHDWTGGYRAYKKEVFLKERDRLRSFSGYTFQVAALYKSIQDGYKVGEVPIHFQDRKLGKSKIAPAEYIYNLLSYVISERIRELSRFIKFLFVGGTGFIVQLVAQEGSVKFGTPHPVGVAIGAETAILSNFFINNFWTFSDTHQVKERGNFLTRLLKFNFVSFGAIVIQFLADFFAELIFGPTMEVFSYKLPTRIVILFPTIILLVIPLNYFIYNKIIWKTHKLQKNRII